MGWPVLMTIALLCAAVMGDELCLSAPDEDPYLLFGDKTAYLFGGNRQINRNDKVHEVPGCQPVAIWLLNRHGSHNPEAEEMAGLQQLATFRANVINNYRNGNFRNTNKRICNSDLDLLATWEWGPGLNASFAGHLTTDGYMTTQERAREWRQKYPGLLTDNIHDYMFHFVDEPRSATTFKAFTEGLFRAQAEIIDIPKATDENVKKLLRPQDFCPAWTNEIEKNNETQRHIFESKQEYKEMITNVSLRLGFNYDLNKSLIKRMYKMCRYNKAWAVDKISPWCAVFSKEDLLRLEYAEDLDTYYKYGYGTSLNQNIGCTMVKGMVDFFNKTHIDHEDAQQPKAMIQFGDAADILLLTTALNVHRDTAPITGDNYRTLLARNRQWRTSTISPFNANIAAVLYKCTLNGNFQLKERYQVLFLENGQPMYHLEGCRVGLCDWSTVLARYGPVAEKCDNSYCNSAMRLTYGLGLAFAIISYILL